MTKRRSLILLIAFRVVILSDLVDAAQWPLHVKRGKVELFADHPFPADAIFQEVQAVESEVKSSLGIASDGLAVQIIVFRNFQSYRNYLSKRIPEALNRQAIFYQDSRVSQVYIVRHREMLTDLRHEFTHALLHHALPYVPLWIDEGVAEFMEERPEQRHRSTRLSTMRWKCRTGWGPRLASLEAIPSAAAMTNSDYQNSWAWVHFLLTHSNESRVVFRGYLSAVSAGEAAGQFSEWAATRAPSLPGKIGSYFRKFQFRIGSVTHP